MYFVETPAAEGLGHRSRPAGGQAATVAADLPRALDLVRAPVVRRGVRMTPAPNNRIRGDYATGRPEPAGPTAAAGPGSFPRAASVRPHPRRDRPTRIGLRVHCAGGIHTAGAASSPYAACREAVEALAAARAMRLAAD